VVLQLEVDFSPVYDREPHPDLDLEKRIEMTWEQRVAKQPSLHNGTKFRYGGYNRAKAGEGMTVSSETVCLHLGLTDYKTFLGTNLSAEWDRFLVPVPDASTWLALLGMELLWRLWIGMC
jgi:hypothetical protein